MAVDAKISFLNQLEQKLGEQITAAALTKTLTTVSDVLQRFDMRESFFDDEPTDDLLDSYVATLKVEGRSQKTIDRYVYIIGKMKEFVKIPCRQITVHHLRNYLAAEKARGISDRTLEGYREIFSTYFNWLQRESLIERNPTANLGPIKCARKVKKIYTDVDLEKLRQECKTPRDRAIVSFLGATGCRISEATELNRDAIDLENLECVVHGKGNKDRTVYLDPVAGMFMREYLNGRKDEEEALFIGKGKRRLQPGGVRAMLKQLGKSAGVDHVHPHKFRRTLATNLSRHGMPLQEVASILGHEKLDTTMKYVVLDNENTKNAYKRYH